VENHPYYLCDAQKSELFHIKKQTDSIFSSNVLRPLDTCHITSMIKQRLEAAHAYIRIKINVISFLKGKKHDKFCEKLEN